MPLSPCQDWTCTFVTTQPTFDPVLETSPKKLALKLPDPKPGNEPRFMIHDVIGVVGAAMIGGFFVQAPLLGVLVGGAGAAALLRLFSSLPTFRSTPTSTTPTSPPASPSSQHRDVLTLGSDGLRVMGMFHPWLRVRRVSAQGHLTLNFCDGREWCFRTDEAQQIAEDAQRRMRWALRGKAPYLASLVGYRSAAKRRYSESQGLPTSLRTGEQPAKRVEDYQRLDDETKSRVLGSMADLRTRATFAHMSDLEVRQRWIMDEALQ